MWCLEIQARGGTPDFQCIRCGEWDKEKEKSRLLYHVASCSDCVHGNVNGVREDSRTQCESCEVWDW